MCKFILHCAVLIIMAAAALAQAQQPVGETKDRQGAGEPNYGSLGFDNTRFFSPGAGEDWLRICASGKREFISDINPRRTALLLVDLQNGCVAWGDALASCDKEVGEAFNRRMQQIVLPNTQKLIKLFREKDMLIVWLRLFEQDTFPESIAPDPQRVAAKREHVVSKFSPGAFATSTLDNVLRENGIATLMVGGVDTAACVLCTITAAHDRTYQVVLVEDALVGSRQEMHEAVVKIWNWMGFVRSTEQVVEDYPWHNWIYPDKGPE